MFRCSGSSLLQYHCQQVQTVNTDRVGVLWLARQGYSVWVLGVGWLNLADPLVGLLLWLGLWVRQQWGHQRHWWH